MNRKNFTRLAGALLLLGMSFVVHAQSTWVPLSKGGQKLRLDAPVKKLVKGPNQGYFHLKVDSVSFYTGGQQNLTTTPAVAGTRYLNDTTVLFMSKADAFQQNKLFVSDLNSATTGNLAGYFSPTAPKSEASAASLWCTIVNDYDQGQNPTFDFINKQQRETALEVDVHGYYGWAIGADGFHYDNLNPNNKVPGGISGWEFSIPYATTVHKKKPLISYVTKDSVAVLCYAGTVTTPVGPAIDHRISDDVVVKIASAMDVKNAKVDGIIYFTLTEAKPFVLDEDDYNTMFGTKNSGGQNLAFTPDVDTQHTNWFSSGKLQAEYITESSPTVLFITGKNAQAKPYPNALDTVRRAGTYLDTLGYMHVKHASKGYLSVAHKYYYENQGGEQFLDWEFRGTNLFTGITADQMFTDSVKFSQAAFRFVYYPSGDSIYINPFQAVYFPSYNPQAFKGDTLDSWTDGLILSNDFLGASSGFTYRADTSSSVNALELSSIVTTDPYAWQDTMAARLKYGVENPLTHGPYVFYHKLYVNIQNLTGAKKIATLGHGNTKNHGINTQINFGLYQPCGGLTGYVSIDPDLYLIRNADGHYLTVPFHAATDSCSWIAIETDVHPELMPSFQWVVQKRYINSPSSSITIANREFPWLEFEVRMKEDHNEPFIFRVNSYDWNTKKVNAKTTLFSKDDKKASFIALDTKYKNDKLLGYTWINPDTSVVNLYAFNYISGITDKNYLGWSGDLTKYPNTDTLVNATYGTYFDKMYFRLDTIDDDNTGKLQKYGYQVNVNTQVKNLVTLERQAYRLVYDDPFKYTCKSNMLLTNAENDNYALGKRGAYRPYLGKPAFFLRHAYNVSGENYFSLVQIVDTTTINPQYPSNIAAFQAFMTQKYGSQLTNLIMNRLLTNGGVNFNPGLFVANVDDNTGRLKTAKRHEAQTRYSTFRLEKDADPIYRRFNTALEGDKPGDEPEVVNFYSMNASSKSENLFENTGALTDQFNYWKDGKKNYLGWVNVHQHPTASTAIYVDTAYVNRGTGYIKPQYMLVVDPKVIEPTMGCNEAGDPVIPLEGYLRGRYLVNAHDSAYASPGVENRDYLWRSKWVRLVFTDALHARDHLYILSGADLEKLDVWGKLQTGGRHIDLNKLDVEAAKTGTKIKKIFLGNNKHKDCVFSFRLIERNAKDFIIESETTNRDFANGPIIRPCEGGWIKIQDNVPVVTPSDEIANMGNGEPFNVTRTDKFPTTIDPEVETSKIQVVGGEGSVSILNAGGKRVVISNILGQTIANSVLSSSDATVTAPKGIVVVAVEGEPAVKALVK